MNNPAIQLDATGKPIPVRKTLVVTFDVTNWNDDQIERLAEEIVAQGDATDDHPEANGDGDAVTSYIEHGVPLRKLTLDWWHILRSGTTRRRRLEVLRQLAERLDSLKTSKD